MISSQGVMAFSLTQALSGGSFLQNVKGGSIWGGDVLNLCNECPLKNKVERDVHDDKYIS